LFILGGVVVGEELLEDVTKAAGSIAKKMKKIFVFPDK